MLWWLALGILILLIILRRFHQKYSQDKFKYRLYVLRDRVRRLKLEGKLEDQPDWLFDYYDQSISKSISRSYYLTIYSLLIFSLRHDGDEKLNEFHQVLEQRVKGNSDLESLSEDYIEAIGTYIIDQHYVSYKLLIRPILSVVLGAKRVGEILDRTLTYPEISVSKNYQMAVSSETFEARTPSNL